MDLAERTDATTSRHPWERARWRFLATLVGSHLAPGDRGRWLDFGAGDAWVADGLARMLGASWSVWAVDPYFTDLDLAAATGGTPDAAVARRSRMLPQGRFRGASAFDVFEHIDDDRRAYAEIVERLEPGAVLFVTVPAHPRLYGDHDRALLHVRRYSTRSFRELLESVPDAVVVESGSFFVSLLAPRAIAVVVERVRRARGQQGVGAWSRGALVTAVAERILTADARLCRRLSRRGIRVAGLSLYAVVRRGAAPLSAA